MQIRLLVAAFSFVLGAFMSAASAQGTKPTIILVHGAFAESSSWNDVVADLLADGYPVVAAANPLRGVKSDAEYVSRIVDSINGPVVLVGHSYGGSVISNVRSQGKVTAHVHVAAFALEQGESTVEMSEPLPRQHARTDSRDASVAFGRRPGPLHPAGQVRLAVRRRRAGQGGDAGCRDPAADERGGARRAFRRPGLEVGAFVAHLRRRRQEHTAGCYEIHG